VRQLHDAIIEELMERYFLSVYSRVEARSNTSIVGGDEKGSLEYETVKYGCESQGTVLVINDRTILSSERAPRIKKHATL
jgi:hypothetical protein